MLLPHVNGMPEGLRIAYRAWQAETLTDANLRTASYHVALDFLPSYAYCSFPATPSEVAAYRALPLAERAAFTHLAQLEDEYREFFQQERGIKSANASNYVWLKELELWARIQDPMVHTAITQQLATHEAEPWTP